MNYGFNTTGPFYWQTTNTGDIGATLKINIKIEAIGGRVEDFEIEPNEKLILEAGDGVLFLVSKEKKIPIAPLNNVEGNYIEYFMQKDKTDKMIIEANNLMRNEDPMQRMVGGKIIEMLKEIGLSD